MENVRVDLGEDTYTVHIERGLFENLPLHLEAFARGRRTAVITDTHVADLYGNSLCRAMKSAGMETKCIVIQAGEGHKNMDTLAQVYASLAAMDISRNDLILTLGGGVVGDVGGFAAATYLRGIPFVQVPTSIIAQVDSSVGGKVGIDLQSGKNQVGAFYQPKAVYIDPQLLDTLPRRCFRDGMGEVVKYGAVCDAKLFEILERSEPNALDWTGIIRRCVQAKAAIVEDDVYDKGRRMLLNFGHTFGHAVERYYGYGTYMHGEAVAVGMVRVTARTECLELTEPGTAKRLEKLLRQYNLPVDVDGADEDIFSFVKRDKKRRGKDMTLAIIDRIGQGRLLPVACEEVKNYLRRSV